MVRFDTLKLEISNDALMDYTPVKYLKSKTFDNENNQLTDIFYLDEKQLGIKSIKINRHRESTEIELSAKVLKGQYYDLINKNTVEQTVKNINDTGIIKFDIPEFIDTAIVHRCDITNNLIPSSDKKKIIRDLSIYSTGAKYKTTPHETGISISAKAKSNNERLIAYSKYEELTRNTKANRIFREHIDVEKFKNVFRIEGNYRNYKNIRNAFHLKTGEHIFLKDLLVSKEKVNYKTFTKMFDITKTDELDLKELRQKSEFIDLLDTDFKLFNGGKRTGFFALEKMIGREQIIKYCNYDIDLIRRIIQSKVKGNISRYVREYRTLIKLIRNKQIGDFESIKEVKRLLKAS